MPQAAPRHSDSFKKERDNERPTAQQRGYTSKWHKESRVYLHDNPWCVDCLAEGVHEKAKVVDHKIPHKGDMKLFWDRDNWQGLCTPHHNRKTVTQDGGFGNAM